MAQSTLNGLVILGSVKAFLPNAVVQPMPVILIDPLRLATMRGICVSEINFTEVKFFLSHIQFQGLITNPSLVNLFDPCTKHADLLQGFCGTLLGTEVWTDAFMPPDQQFLPFGSVYVGAFKGDDLLRLVNSSLDVIQ